MAGVGKAWDGGWVGMEQWRERDGQNMEGEGGVVDGKRIAIRKGVGGVTGGGGGGAGEREKR